MGKLPIMLALVLGLSSGAAADVLWRLTTAGELQAIDAATGAVQSRRPLTVQDGVLLDARGLAIDATTNEAWALASVSDPCTLDSSRTTVPLCGSLRTPEECNAGAGAGPVACHFDSDDGCLPCRGSRRDDARCLDTCAPPPVCEGAPEREHFAGLGADACRLLDGDPDCDAAFHLGPGGPAACFTDGDLCRGCDLAAEAAGACERACAPRIGCADPGRPVFVQDCRSLENDLATCLLAYDEQGGVPSACREFFGFCVSCRPEDVALGDCTNACAPPPACANGDRTFLERCEEASGNPAACTGGYTVYGGLMSCFHAGDECLACDPLHAGVGECADACNPPVCEDDPSRDLLAGGAAGCRAFDSDSAACGRAFHTGCGVSSCTFDVASGECRACTFDDPGGCTNACGSFTTLDAPQQSELMRLNLGAGTSTRIHGTGAGLAQLAIDGGGSPAAITMQHLALPVCLRPGFVTSPESPRVRRIGDAGVDPQNGAMAFSPTDGLLYVLGRSFATGDLVFQTVDPTTGESAPRPYGGPDLTPRAMTWVPACGAFVLEDRHCRLFELGRDGAVTSLFGVGSCGDERDLQAAGLAFEGDTVCPPLPASTTSTSSSTTTSTSSSTTTTFPNQRLTGARLLLTDHPRKARKRRLVVVSKDAALDLGLGNVSADDPVLHGGTLRLVGAAPGAFDVTHQLTGWQYVGGAGAQRGYRFRSDGAIRKVVLRPGKRLAIAGRGDLGTSLFTDPGDVQVVLRLGGREWCLTFGGTRRAASPRRLLAVDAPAPAACPPSR